VDDFVKKSSLIYFSEGALRRLGEDIICVAELEGLTAHAESVKIRITDRKES
jgi:histidinol dehydrogenase